MRAATTLGASMIVPTTMVDAATRGTTLAGIAAGSPPAQFDIGAADWQGLIG